MALFNICMQSMQAARPAEIETPFGNFATCFLVGKVDTLRAAATETRGDGRRHWSRWEWDEFDIELLQGPIATALPPGMRVDGCIAALWRIRGKRVLKKRRPSGQEDWLGSVRCCWATEPSAAEGGPDTGEGLEALTWDISGGRLSVGTEDPEFLASRAPYDRFFRIGRRIDVDAVSFIRSDQSGLEVPVPALRQGEWVQVQFVVAWRNVVDADDVSTWFAVDQDPTHLLALLGERIQPPSPTNTD